MENSNYHRIARTIAFIDEIWALIDFLYTFVTFFGGELGDGLFYQVELHADLGLPPDQVTGKQALTGLLFFITLLYNLIWVFAGYMLFKGTETTAQCPVLYRKKLQYCRIWFCASILLLIVPGINMLIYLTDSLLEIILAMSAFLTRGVFMYLVLKYMLQLQKGPPNTPQIQAVRYAPGHNNEQQPPTHDSESQETTPFNPNISQGQGQPGPRGGYLNQNQNQSQNQSPSHGRSRNSNANKKSNNSVSTSNGNKSPKNNNKVDNCDTEEENQVSSSSSSSKSKSKKITPAYVSRGSSGHTEIDIELEKDPLINSNSNLRINPMFA